MATAKTDDIPEGHVKVRVLRKGDGKISTGERRPNETGSHEVDIAHAQGDHFVLPRAQGEHYEDRGFVEIV